MGWLFLVEGGKFLPSLQAITHFWSSWTSFRSLQARSEHTKLVRCWNEFSMTVKTFHFLFFICNLPMPISSKHAWVESSTPPINFARRQGDMILHIFSVIIFLCTKLSLLKKRFYILLYFIYSTYWIKNIIFI